MFPHGLPGLALVLLRALVAWMLLHERLGLSATGVHPWALFAAAGLALLMVLGLMTPLACVGCLAVEAFAWSQSEFALATVPMREAGAAVVLALLGPGGYSLDARLFGRRKVRIPDDEHG